MAKLTVACLSDCTPSFEQYSTCKTTEACPGSTLELICRTVKYQATVFQGNALNCSSTNNEITLLHSRFNTSSGINGTCNNGEILGYSLPVTDSSECYTSLLCITVSPDMIGKHVKCAYDNGTTAKEIGSYTVEQCHATTVITVAPSTGKLVINPRRACARVTVVVLCVCVCVCVSVCLLPH